MIISVLNKSREIGATYYYKTLTHLNLTELPSTDTEYREKDFKIQCKVKN